MWRNPWSTTTARRGGTIDTTVAAPVLATTVRPIAVGVRFPSAAQRISKHIMNNNNGWVKLYRSLITWEWWDDDVTTKLFIYCLIMANHEDTKWHGVPVKRGSFITSLENLSAGIKKTVQVTRTALNHLQKTGELTSKSTNKGRIITINNYDAYQQSEDTNQQTNAQADNKQLTSNQQATNKQLTSNNRKAEKQGVRAADAGGGDGILHRA